jgi:5'-nucleotidase (lipoprotein e(P4) family)
MNRPLARRPLAALALLLTFAACAGSRQPARLAPADGKPTLEELARTAAFLDTLYATLWMQTAEEKRGLALQAYGAASALLDTALADRQWTASLEQRDQGGYQDRAPAIIVDIDETVLDNTPSQTLQIRKGTRWNTPDWNAWCAEERAEAIPGAREFLVAATAKGVTVFYVSNRSTDLLDCTRRNLEKQGFPLAKGLDPLRFKGKGESSDKGPRRAAIAREYRIVMMAGDDLGDFHSGNRTDAATRAAKTQPYLDYWGRRWIVLPNPIYGSWVDSFHGFQSLHEQEAIERLLEALKE